MTNEESFEKFFYNRFLHEMGFATGKESVKFVWDSAIAYMQEQSAEIAQLKANINDLREVLEKTAIKIITDGNPSTTYLYVVIHEALSKTPAQCLQAHDNEVIERIAYAFNDEPEAVRIMNKIRALKATND